MLLRVSFNFSAFFAQQIKEYLKSTDEQHSDFSKVKTISQDIEKLTKAVNISIKKEQNRVKLIDIEKSFVKFPLELKNLFAEGTHLFIREGFLTKECRKTTKKKVCFFPLHSLKCRFFWLFNDFLFYGTPVAGQTAGRQMYSYHRTLHLKEKARVTSLADTVGLIFCFNVDKHK